MGRVKMLEEHLNKLFGNKYLGHTVLGRSQDREIVFYFSDKTKTKDICLFLEELSKKLSEIEEELGYVKEIMIVRVEV